MLIGVFLTDYGRRCLKKIAHNKSIPELILWSYTFFMIGRFSFLIKIPILLNVTCRFGNEHTMAFTLTIIFT